MHKPEILLFDDDEANIRFLDTKLNNFFKIKGIQNPHLYEEAINPNVCAILIDLLMPIMCGIELFQVIKSNINYNGCPIIFISGSASHEMKLKSIVAGGHDFFVKSMNEEEMVERLKNRIQAFKTDRNIFILGSVKISLLELKAYLRGAPLELTLTEFKIIKSLIKSYPAVQPREEINETIWPGMKVLPTTLNTHLSNLRNKFHDWEYEINMVKNKGVFLRLIT